MSEIFTREIVGLATISKWNKIKEDLKALIKNTLKKNAGYTFIALDVYINKKKKSNFTDFIKSEEDIKKLNGIGSFSNLSLYQYTETSSDHINISQQEGIIILIAKYLGPTIEQHEHFDFMIHMDPINDPYFTYGSGQILNCSQMLEIINKNKKIKKKPVKIIKHRKQMTKKSKIPENSKKEQSKLKKENIIQDIETFIFEKLKGKNPLWGGKETKTFIAWKKRMADKYIKESGKVAYYKGNPTKNYRNYLETILNHNRNKGIKKKVSKKKNNKIVEKKKEEISEHLIFEKLTKKKAFWGGKETRSFTTWKKKVREKFTQETGKNTHYKGKYTTNYRIYLEKLITSR